MATYLALKAGCKIHPVETGPNLHEYVVETSDKRLYRLSTLSRDIIKNWKMADLLKRFVVCCQRNMRGQQPKSYAPA